MTKTSAEDKVRAKAGSDHVGKVFILNDTETHFGFEERKGLI